MKVSYVLLLESRIIVLFPSSSLAMNYALNWMPKRDESYPAAPVVTGLIQRIGSSRDAGATFLCGALRYFSIIVPGGFGIYSDPEKTCKSIEKFSKHDAKSYRDFFESSKKMVDEFIAPPTYAPPSPAIESLIKMQTADIGKEIMEFSEKSPKMVVDEYFENERVKALMLYCLCMWGLDPTQTGVGYLIPLYINRSANYRLVVHGSPSPRDQQVLCLCFGL